MSDLHKLFGVLRDGGQPNSECVLQKQNWELGVVNGTLPVLRVNLIGQTQYDFHQLVNALKDNELPVEQRVRSNGDMVMEVRGADNFMKLANILGQERISQIQHNTDLEHIKSINWQQGQQDGVMMTIYADGKYDPNVKTVADTLERLGNQLKTT